MKTAVVLFNLGGPDRPEAIKPFLFNLFNDPAIIRLPKMPRFLLAKFMSSRREKTAQEIYAKIGGGSPILANTQQQAKALEEKIGARCFVAMRYWHPFVEQTVAEVKAYAPDRIILLPLYPQFSTTTTQSSLASWEQATAKAGLKISAQTICCYPDEPGFIGALADKIHPAYEEAKKYGSPRLLFSAHGLPEKIVKAGDPYPQHCQSTVEALCQALNIPGLNSVLCYQSRVGPLTWIGPSTDDEIRRAGRERVPLIIVPIAFVSEHSETLVEIDIDYRRLAQESGVPFFAYTGTVGTAPDFIDGLTRLVRIAMEFRQPCRNSSDARICPRNIYACPMGNF